MPNEAPRKAGDDLQEIIFWQEACRLFCEPDVVENVAFSDDRRMPGFDDVVVAYVPDKVFDGDIPLHGEAFQIKLQDRADRRVDDRLLTHRKSASSTSLLEHLRSVRLRTDSDGGVWRCHLMAVAGIVPSCALARLIRSGHDGTLDLAQLRESDDSDIVKLRNSWMRALDIGSPDELVRTLTHLRIETVGSRSTNLGHLDARLRNAGLKTLGQDLQGWSPYKRLLNDDMLGREPHRSGPRFTREDLLAELTKHNLVVAMPRRSQPTQRVGVRTLTRDVESWDGEMDSLLCLAGRFDGRAVRAEASWETDVRQSVERFLAGLPRDPMCVELHLAACLSVAFVVGAWFHPTSGYRVTLAKRSSEGTQPWEPTRSVRDCGGLAFREQTLSAAPGLAVGLSVSRDVEAAVLRHVADHNAAFGTILWATPEEGPGVDSVRGGSHAQAMAHQLAQHIRAWLDRTGEDGSVHLFAACPDGLAFYIGQNSRLIGPVQMYELDGFGTSSKPRYQPSLRVPR